MQVIPGEEDRTVVEFKNIKKRGNVELETAYSYSKEQDLTYDELLSSVEKVDEEELDPLKSKAEQIVDEEVIKIIEKCIRDGINTKMELVKTAADRAQVSRRHATSIIEKYTGDDPTFHRWYYKTGERGAKIFDTIY
jgi:hypothetical protein